MLHVAGAVCGAEVHAGARIAVHDGVIAAIEDVTPRGDLWAVPGFVDTHTHGAVGVDFGSADADGVRRVLDFQRRQGTTTSFASLATDDVDRMVAQTELLADFVESGELAGIHLEGPFLAPSRRGAHARDLLRTPAPDMVDRLLTAGRGAVAMMTIAPELPGAGDVIDQLIAAGVTVAFGHSDADAATGAAAVDRGVRVATHLFNAMRPLHHREPGPVPGLLTDSRVALELIVDGQHLAPEVVRLVAAAASPERMLLVSDSMAATGLGDGRFPLGATDVEVVGGVARLPGADAPLAGSTLTMGAAVREVVRNGIGLPTAARWASTNPARVHGLAYAGVLAVGHTADLVLMEESGEIDGVLFRGHWVEGMPNRGRSPSGRPR